jgi:hypothetical protein
MEVMLRPHSRNMELIYQSIEIFDALRSHHISRGIRPCVRMSHGFNGMSTIQSYRDSNKYQPVIIRYSYESYVFFPFPFPPSQSRVELQSCTLRVLFIGRVLLWLGIFLGSSGTAPVIAVFGIRGL